MKRKRIIKKEFVTSSTREEEFAKTTIYASDGEIPTTKNKSIRKRIMIFQTVMGYRMEFNKRIRELEKDNKRREIRKARKAQKNNRKHVQEQKLLRLQDKFNTGLA